MRTVDSVRESPSKQRIQAEGISTLCGLLMHQRQRLVITRQMLIYLDSTSTDGSRLTASLTVMVRFLDMCKLITIIRIIDTKLLTLNRTVHLKIHYSKKKCHESNILAWVIGWFYRTVQSQPNYWRKNWSIIEEQASGQPNLEQFFTHLRACLKGH